MGNLVGSLRYREPSTVEECDSTWETDSESEELQEQQPGDHLNITEPSNEADSKEGDQENANIQNNDTRESAPKLKRSFYAAKDLYKYRHRYPNSKEHRQPSEYRNLRFYLNTIPLIPDDFQCCTNPHPCILLQETPCMSTEAHESMQNQRWFTENENQSIRLLGKQFHSLVTNCRLSNDSHVFDVSTFLPCKLDVRSRDTAEVQLLNIWNPAAVAYSK